jgi:hypothetical protein
MEPEMRKLTIALSAVALSAVTLTAPFAARAEPSPRHEQGFGHGPTTRAELLAHIDEIFARLDVNGDGKLDQADRDARKAQVFDRLDTDGNGSIDRAEFDAAGGKRHERMGERGPAGDGPRFGHRFGGQGDAEGPGKHRGPEGFGGRGGPRAGMGLAMIGKMADTNGDGAITKDEFKTAALAMFDRADANGDGTISPDERQAMRAAHRPGHDGPGQ